MEVRMFVLRLLDLNAAHIVLTRAPLVRCANDRHDGESISIYCGHDDWFFALQSVRYVSTSQMKDLRSDNKWERGRVFMLVHNGIQMLHRLEWCRPMPARARLQRFQPMQDTDF